MTDEHTPENTAETAPEPTVEKTEGERIAKAMARAGVASRREAERMILEGRVKVNGRPVTSPALDILPTDKVQIDGKQMDEPQETRLWMYYKPLGLVTTESDEKGRQTVFDALPRELPRVMTVGRLDLNSEGLLLLTNDGELKRRLEMPATGWLRRYRVRVNGQPTELTFDPLRRGVTIDGEDFAPMEIRLDSQQGANAWLTVGIREGKNREIRRAMAHVGLIVNRLIRIGYGPFKLTGMEENEVREIKRRVLRDQLGGLLTGEEDVPPRAAYGRPPRDDSRRPEGRAADGDAPRKPRHKAEGGRPERAPYARDGAGRRDGEFSRGPREGGFDRGPRYGAPHEGGFKRGPRDGDAPRGSRDDRPPRFSRDGRDGDAPRGDRPARFPREGGRAFDKGDRPHRSFGDRPSFGKPQADRSERGGDRGPRKDYGDSPRRSFSPRTPREDGGEGWSSKPRFDKPRYDKGPRRDDGDAPRRDGFARKDYGRKDFSRDDSRRDDAGRSFASGERPARSGKPGGFKSGFKSGPRSGDGPRPDGGKFGGPRTGDRFASGASKAPRGDRAPSGGPKGPRGFGPKSGGPRPGGSRPGAPRGKGGPRG